MSKITNIRQTIEYDGWVMDIDFNNVLTITKEGESREYTIPDRITKIEHDNEYVWLTTERKEMFQFKFEENDFLVGDVFDADGEHNDSIACHVFGQGDEF